MAGCPSRRRRMNPVPHILLVVHVDFQTPRLSYLGRRVPCKRSCCSGGDSVRPSSELLVLLQQHAKSTSLFSPMPPYGSAVGLATVFISQEITTEVRFHYAMLARIPAMVTLSLLLRRSSMNLQSTI